MEPQFSSYDHLSPKSIGDIGNESDFSDGGDDDEDNDTLAQQNKDRTKRKAMGLISELVEQILCNLQVSVTNTQFIILHPSPFDEIKNTILKVSLRELSMANTAENDEEKPSTSSSLSSNANKNKNSKDKNIKSGQHVWKKRLKFSGLMVQLFHTIWNENNLKIEKNNSLINLDDCSNVIIYGEPEEHGQNSYIDIEAPLESQTPYIGI